MCSRQFETHTRCWRKRSVHPKSRAMPRPIDRSERLLAGVCASGRLRIRCGQAASVLRSSVSSKHRSQARPSAGLSSLYPAVWLCESLLGSRIFDLLRRAPLCPCRPLRDLRCWHSVGSFCYWLGALRAPVVLFISGAKRLRPLRRLPEPDELRARAPFLCAGTPRTWAPAVA